MSRTPPAARRATWTRPPHQQQDGHRLPRRQRQRRQHRLDRQFLVGNGDNLLSEGELAEITVDTTEASLGTGNTLGPNQAFTIEVKPPTGGTMVIARTTPAGLDTVVDLH